MKLFVKSTSLENNKIVKITKRSVEAADVKDSDYIIWDKELPGFGLRVFRSGRRSYLIQYRAKGRTSRYTIEAQGVWIAATARKEARKLLGQIAQGENPAEQRHLNNKAVSMKELCELYLRAANLCNTAAGKSF